MSDLADRYPVVSMFNVVIDYTNHHGVTSQRLIRPVVNSFRFIDMLPWYPEIQWLFDAYCFERKAYRTFALANVKSWRPDAPRT